jgi:very-short-patch-repair endonuclease
MEAHESTPRAEAVEKAVKVWTGQLVDLTGRNNLLYFRDLKVGTLDLGKAPQQLLFDVLAGKVVTLSRLFSEEEARADALRRARAVRNRAQEHFEERGLETMFLACGMATWTNLRGTATPCAPVLLVPARLAPRGAAQEEFELSVTAELEVNPTLLQMLRSEFDVDCDPEDLLASAGMEGAIDTPEELDLAFQWLSEHAHAVPGFAVSQRFVLGTFSYAKLPMVNDLEAAIEDMVRHDLIAALAGDGEARAAIRERRASGVDPTDPNHVPPSDEFLVLDADASQNYAINAVVAGQDLVIKGPPGTGKSQTISNLIATLVARGKRVLFVAEKRAAIDAVLRRLEDVGLGDLVLDLHGGVGSRREVAQSLASALVRNATIAKGDYRADHKLLQSRRDELNMRADALHKVRQPWGLSAFDAQARLLELGDGPTSNVRFRGAALEALSAEARDAARESLRAYAGLGGMTLSVSDSPWASAAVVSAEEAQAAQRLCEQLRHHTVPTLMQALRAAAQGTGVRSAETMAEWADRVALWTEVAESSNAFDEAVFGEPLKELIACLAPLGRGAPSRAAASVTDGEFRAARKAVKQHLRDGVKPSPRELLVHLEACADQAERWSQVAVNGSAPGAPDNLATLRASFDEMHGQLAQLTGTLNRTALEGSDEQICERLDALLNDTPTLAKLPELHRLRSALDRAGLRELVADCEQRSLAPEAALIAFDHAWLSSLVDHIRLTDPLVGAFEGEQHSRTVAEFQEADRRHIETTAQRVRRLVAEQATKAQDEFEDQGALIRDQAARKRKHLSLRQLFSATPDVMTTLKPCWAMSPLVVSQLLPSDQQYFDVAIFDEASQVRPADAIPAILRAKQLVVAGDERQLPPTDFFTGTTSDDDTLMEGRIVVDTGFESILEALLPFLDFRMLSWHYRSRDERLIAFSNAHLYAKQLTTFPGVSGPDCVKHELVPFHHGEIGSDVSAADEVQRVVGLILDHAERRPDESLGVIAMGIKHADRIDEALRRALAGRDDDLEEFFDESRHERFFVKNLERVQGDERDAIILSIGYGKTPDGRLLYRFGPLNREGGERRLNVAVTRAKNRMTLVSAFGFADMEPGRSSAVGVELMRLYLRYAESRGEQLDRAALEAPELNPFEVDIRDTLNRAGIPLVAQYGASGYRIDFAAKHPDQPGRMVLAIECDGASYHSSETARDRDRLRQEQLERLGWTFHRIWSQDWFNNKERETEKTVTAYRAAVARVDDDSEPKPVRPTPPPPSNGPAPSSSRGPRPPVPRFRSIDEYTIGQLRSVVRWVKSDTLLRTQSQLLADVMSELGFQKRGKRIVAALTHAILLEDGQG